jgi:hypothetical protein
MDDEERELFRGVRRRARRSAPPRQRVVTGEFSVEPSVALELEVEEDVEDDTPLVRRSSD